ncbi:hypothetical protein QTP86_030608, partial [Hemibagrus guttatus]
YTISAAELDICRYLETSGFFFLVFEVDEENPEFWRSQAQATLNSALRRKLNTKVAKNIVLFLGDGMGITTITAARILKGQLEERPGEETVMTMDTFPYVGLAKVYTVDFQIPDSGATGTAYLCGVKTNLNIVGLSAAARNGVCRSQTGNEVTSILKWAKDAGKSVGIVTTTRVQHATPAASYAHSASRKWYSDADMPAAAKRDGCTDIASQLISNTDIDVIIGGGRKYMTPKDTVDPEYPTDLKSAGMREDKRNLINEWINVKEGKIKMAPQTAATVFRCALLFIILCSYSVLCHSSGSSYSREELMNIRATTPVDLFPSFLASTADLLAILIKEARNKVKSRRRGKRSGVLVRLRRRGLRTPLPGIFLSNVRSLCNKMDELTLQMNKNRDFPTSCVLCFTETWLCDAIPDSALQLGGFNLYRADRHTELSGKTKGGGICFYTNNSWCNDVKVLSQLCSPDLEAFIINCKPFYSPREFSSFILVGVYIPPQGNVREAQRALADEIQSVERTNPDALVIVLGDFNKGNLSHELPKYKQFIKCPTREGNVLDHCYTTISGAYRAVPRAALGQSDHIMVHLIPAYRQKLKLCKPVVRTSKKWTSEAVGELQGCLDCTDWDVFRSTTNSLDEYTDTVSSYIYFCEDSIIPTCTRVSYNNDKPWFTAKLRRLRSEKEAAFRSGDRGKYKEAKYRFSKEVRKAKTEHGERMQQQFQTNDSASVWKGLKAIINYKPRAPHSVNDLRLANSLNEYYCRFERQWNSPDPPQSSPHQLSPTQLHTSATPHPPPLTPLTIKEEEVNRLFKRLNTRKASGPDSVSPSLLKHCANQLSPVFTDIFNTSLETCHVPACFKTSAIVPVPKKTKITGLNDYRPVALTSVVMKSFERLVLSYLKDITDPLLDPLQFAYRANRSVDDAVNMALHFILQHLDSPGSYARILFVDFSSAFNTIIPALLRDKLFQLNVPDSMCSWITDFLTDRRQFVRLGTHVSDLQHISTGSPQGCVLSPLLFSLYTNGCTSGHQSVKLLKFADDTTLIGLISDGNESAYRGEIDRLVSWCSTNNLELNSLKTVEMTVDFRKDPAPRPPVNLCDSPVSSAESFCFLGTTITKELKWAQNISSLTKKAQQRMYFLRQLKKFLLPVKMLVNFYTAIIESVLTSSITVWFAAATARDKAKLQRVIHSAEKVAHYVWNKTEFDAVDPETTDYLMALFEPGDLRFEVERDPLMDPSIIEMTEKAIRILQKNPRGFFLLVEGGRIDQGHHASRASMALHETVALDNAVARALELTNEEETLTVVTADHSHSLSFNGYPSRGNSILGKSPVYGTDMLPYTTLMYGNGPGHKIINNKRPDIRKVDTKSKDYVQLAAVPLDSETHGGEDVAVLARGPMAHLFQGINEQNYIAHAMAYAACVGTNQNHCYTAPSSALNMY